MSTTRPIGIYYEHFYTLNYLAHLEQLGVRVVKGLAAFRTETSKALHLSANVR